MLRDEIDKIIPEVYCGVPQNYGIKAIHATATKGSKGSLPPYLVELMQENGKDLAKAIEERLTELGYVKLSELVLDAREIKGHLRAGSDLFHKYQEGQCSIGRICQDLAHALSTAKGIIKIKK